MVYSFRMRFFPIVLLVASINLAGCKKPESDPPVEAVREFYTWRIAARATGAPSSAELAKMSPYLSGELRTLLEKAAAEYPNIANAKEDERTIEHGDWFTSMFDGPTSFTIGGVEPLAGGHVVTVRFTSAKQLPSVNWRDWVTVVQEDGRYVIADVAFGNHWLFRDKASLMEALKDPKVRRKRRS
jgi:hypothetical protein